MSSETIYARTFIGYECVPATLDALSALATNPDNVFHCERCGPDDAFPAWYAAHKDWVRRYHQSGGAWAFADIPPGRVPTPIERKGIMRTHDDTTPTHITRAVASYCLSLRWTGDCAVIWSYAAMPLIAATAMGLLLMLPVLAIGSGLILMVLFLGVGLAAHSPLDRPDGRIEASKQRRDAEVARTTLARAGLTAEQYLATFPAEMWIERAMAAHHLGVSSDGKRIL